MSGFILRWVCAFGLLAGTFNPTDYNFLRWVMQSGEKQWSLIVLTGLVLLIGYIIYLRATLRSIGAFGMILVLAVFGALIWVAVDLGWLNLANPTANIWIALGAMATVLAVGLSWSHVRRRLSGQADVDDLDE